MHVLRALMTNVLHGSFYFFNSKIRQARAALLQRFSLSVLTTFCHRLRGLSKKMMCRICQAPARGYGFTDGRFPHGDRRRYPRDWVFCSETCQALFQARYLAWQTNQRKGRVNEQSADPAQIYQTALRHCLTRFKAIRRTLAVDKTLREFNEAECLLLIDTIVSSYSEAMIEHHRACAYPPVREIDCSGQASMTTPRPLF